MNQCNGFVGCIEDKAEERPFLNPVAFDDLFFWYLFAVLTSNLMVGI